MTPNAYQKQTAETAIYPGANAIWEYPAIGLEHALNYTVLGLAGEAGEVANTWKKALRDEDGHLSSERRMKLVGELGDVLWYVARIATHLDIPLEEVMLRNLAKLEARKEAGTIGGSGDNR